MGLASTIFVDSSIAIVVEAIAVVIVFARDSTFPPSHGITEVTITTACASMTSILGVTDGEPGSVSDISIACFVDATAIIEFVLVRNTIIKTMCCGIA